MGERETSDEELELAFGEFQEPTTLEDIEKRIDDLELELWNQNEALSLIKVALGCIFLGVLAIFAKLSGWF